jgi:hypothetical protein
MIFYECYHISKSYNFNMKLNYTFNNMEHQTLVTLVTICVIHDCTRYVVVFVYMTTNVVMDVVMKDTF